MEHTRRRNSFAADERGQTLSEYSVLIGLIALVVIAAIPALAGAIQEFFTSAVQVVGG
jgi:Flp pilus assembly pilin Flp